MHRQTINQDPQTSTSNYLFPTIAFSLALIAILTWLVLSIMVSRKFEIAQTELTLKAEACSLLNHEKMQTNRPSTDDSYCSVTIPFRANKFGNGGMIYLNDREILISDNQVISSEIIDPHAWTNEQIKSILIVMFSLAFTTAFVATLFFKLKERR